MGEERESKQNSLPLRQGRSAAVITVSSQRCSYTAAAPAGSGVCPLPTHLACDLGLFLYTPSTVRAGGFVGGAACPWLAWLER